MNKPRILIADGLNKEGIQLLVNDGIEVTDQKMSTNELLREIPPFDGLIVRSKPEVTRAVIEAGKKLKIIGRAGVGYDNIDVEAATEGGIVVKIAPYGNTNSTAELTIGLMLAAARNIPQTYHSLIGKLWERKKYEGSELSGKTLGIIGCGRVGKRVAEIAKYGFGMNVIGYDIHKAANSGITYVDNIDEVLRSSDFVTIHTPAMEKPVIGRVELKIMKSTAILVNTSRGDNVDEEALYTALHEGWIAGAGLDVYKEEPSEGHIFINELFELNNFVGTSHLGASTAEAQRKTGIEIADVVLGYLKEGNWRNAVNVGEDISDKSPTYNVFITHVDKPGMFREISGVFENYRINIGEIPSRSIGRGSAITIIRAYRPITQGIITDLRTLDGVVRVTY